MPPDDIHSHLHPDRRQLLRLAAAAASSLWLPRSAWSQPVWQSNPFALGVASGSPSDSGVVLWTRLALSAAQQAAAAPITVRWEVAHDAQFQRIVQRGQAQALAELGYSVHVEVPALAPDRWYYYRFFSGEAISPVGRTRTLPAPGAAVAALTLAYASCQRWEDGYFAAWRHMQAENVDLVLFLGDYIYEYPGTRSRVRQPGGGWVITLDDYRRRYAVYKSDPDLQAMHAHAPWLMTWDDHELQNDYAGLQAGDSGSAAPPVADFAARRAAAYQAYYENMPLRAAVLSQSLQGLAQGAALRLHSQVAYGRLAHLCLLDARQYKDPQACNKEGRLGSSVVSAPMCQPWADSQRSLLGAAQEDWLHRTLAAAPAQAATWNILGQQTLFGPRNLGSSQQPRYWNDGWDGYSAARSRLLRSLQQHAVPNPVLLGGDVHENWVGHVLTDYAQPSSAAVGVEFCGTSITSHSGAGDPSGLLQRNPHFVFADSRHRGYGMARFSPQRLEVQLRVLDDVTRADASVRTLAQFQVSAGRAQVERVDSA